MEQQQEEVYEIVHKIKPNKSIKVYKSVYQDKAYYKTYIAQKKYDGTSEKFPVQLMFKQGTVLPPECQIKIKKAFENYRKNPKDQYNHIVYYTVIDFELIENPEVTMKNAYDEYNKTMLQNEDNYGEDYTQRVNQSIIDEFNSIDENGNELPF